jgi:hypothetical protein
MHCQHFGVCGGCSLPGIPYATQLAMKQARLETLLGVAVSPLVPSPREDRFRHKVTFVFGSDESGRRIVMGHYAAGGRTMVPVEECPVHSDRGNQLAFTLRDQLTRARVSPDVLRHVMGFGEVPEKALTGPMQKMLDSGFIQAVKMCVDELGFKADPKIRATQEIAVATAPIDSPLGVIEPGQVAARKFHWEALVDGEPVVRVTVNWLMGEESLDPPWTFGPEGQRYEMEVRGNPDITIVVKGFQSLVGGEGPEYGIVGTAAHCVNSVPAVCAAEPGILTMLDLPLISGKAAPHLR